MTLVGVVLTDMVLVGAVLSDMVITDVLVLVGVVLVSGSISI